VWRRVSLNLAVIGLAIAAVVVLMKPPGDGVMRASPRGEAATRVSLGQEAYVWQRRWTAGVAEAVRGADRRLGRLVVLGAEVSFDGGRPRVARAEVDYAALAACGRPVGVAVRIGPYRGAYAADDGVGRLLGDVVAGVVSDARAHGVEPVEVQVDFDAAASKLDGYRTWVAALRRRVAPTPLTITALPSWMDAPGFASLIAACEGLVLPVHSVERPASADAEMTLCDPEKAKVWVGRAAGFGVPFRVALPTYSYMAAFGPGGKLLGLSAEGLEPRWPAAARVRTLTSDAPALARLVRQWSEERPAHLTGVIWYRLPTGEDRLNWRPITLSTILAGKTPAAELRVVSERTPEGAIGVFLTNAGTADAALAGVTVELDWAGAGRRVASDTTAGFTSLDSDDSHFTLVPTAGMAERWLAAGDTIALGWIRLTEDKEVRGHVTIAPSN
jgi:hypothetical protein